MNDDTESELPVDPDDFSWRVFLEPIIFCRYVRVGNNCTERQLADDSFVSECADSSNFAVVPHNLHQPDSMSRNESDTQYTENIHVSHDPTNILEIPTTDSMDLRV